MAESCKHGYEPSGFIKGGKSLDYLSDYQLVRKKGMENLSKDIQRSGRGSNRETRKYKPTARRVKNLIKYIYIYIIKRKVTNTSKLGIFSKTFTFINSGTHYT
jgi:hypothetical protein